MQLKYHSGVGKLLYLVKWSQQEIVNSIWDLACFMTKAYPNHMKGMEHVMQHVLCMPEEIGHAARWCLGWWTTIQVPNQQDFGFR